MAYLIAAVHYICDQYSIPVPESLIHYPGLPEQYDWMHQVYLKTTSDYNKEYNKYLFNVGIIADQDEFNVV